MIMKLRELALDLATKSARDMEAPEQTVERAKAFYAFLTDNGDDDVQPVRQPLRGVS